MADAVDWSKYDAPAPTGGRVDWNHYDAKPAGGDALGRQGAPGMQAENRNWLQRQAQTAGNRATETFNADMAAQHPSGNPAVDATMTGLAALHAAGNAIGAFTGPLVDQNDFGAPDTAETRAQAAEHASPLDYQRPQTNREREDFAGGVVTGLVPVERIARVGGAVVDAARAARPAAATVSQRALSQFVKRAKPNVATLEAQADAFRQVGIEPTLTDATDEAGRGVIQAAASRSGPGRQVAADFANGRRLDLPDRLGNQARANISTDARTPDQIRADLTAQRKVEGDAQFSAVRGAPLTMTPETVSALRTPLAKSAISDAALRERDPEVRAALNRLAGDALDDPSTQITIGMADRVSRVLLGKARAAAQAGDNDLAASYRALGLGIRNPAAATSPGYKAALANFAARSRLIEAAKVGESFMSRNTDEFTAALAAMSPEERTVAQAAARRAVERAAGENVGSAPGVADRLANAPEQQARNRALLGDQGATQLQTGMSLERDAAANAQQINPRSGSPTNIRGVDQAVVEGAGHAVKIGGKVARGDILGAALDSASLWLKSRGMSDAEAEQLVRLATDPKQTQALIAQLKAGVGPKRAAQFMSTYRKPLVRGAALRQAGIAAASNRSSMLTQQSPQRGQ